MSSEDKSLLSGIYSSILLMIFLKASERFFLFYKSAIFYSSKALLISDLVGSYIF